ncbi:ABC transporter ATP-binding protein [Williamsia sp. CHRR-6]|uniref:ABC transporter ATP-binding protein n=1 Tax=Williamsia sp. CHRR-6 TaxID=2835871 RepID=UPI001BDAE7BA|nr:ABC transporter ATP-binding protein [Williamsia sp. CHRR-6]MBT0567311.1 ABC transporter ATP-binding protein [Williamsia sp. CHRR-6]
MTISEPRTPGTVTVTGLGVSIGAAVLLDEVDLTIDAGRWWAVVGPNGAGKSTLLRALVGLTAPDRHTRMAGEVYLGDDPLRQLASRDRARRVGYVPQSPVIPSAVRVADYVLLGRVARHGLLAGPTRADRIAAADAMARVEVDQLGDRELATLSGGERQRAVIARALAGRPQLLVLDEPTAALDLGHAQQVLELIDSLRTDHEMTVVSAIHDLSLAALYAEQVLLLADGRAVATGTPAQVFTESTLRTYYGADVTVTTSDTRVRILPNRPPRPDPPGPTDPPLMTGPR